MASRNEQQRKVELVNQLSQHRQSIAVQKEQLTWQISAKKEAIQEKLNVPKRIKASVTDNPKKWFIGSAIAGLILTRLFRGSRQRRVTESSSNIKPARTLLATITIMAIKPMIKSFALRKVKGFIAQKIAARYTQQPEQEYYAE